MNHIISATVQSAILSATSNILAQVISAYNDDRPFTISLVPLLQFVLFTILATPPNCLWQEWLEDVFPGQTSEPVYALKSATDEQKKSGKGKSKVVSQTTKRLNVKNTIIKFVLDQTVGAAVNIAMFIGGIGTIKGRSSEEIMSSLKNDSFPFYMAGVKLWPIVSVLCFTLVPVNRRVVVGSIAGVLWNIFLSLQASK
ncbi:hypothetical protein P152DRAFT_170353 [Eremomyces bilateralis CBS 781.70]|uniref:Integral membrane protein, Mpv17/PMP22 family n=1 Tax=Eremomyces bilateralis CBS 781.70 TaxID=1392243 RepID=A0A6G1FTX6_9PEZI|nr:uncharacterized protein P152DRAFT_170353 [Eremomyces bilateralis CBS 781.70]KAF1809129.1 hypothetical protein P152DRAFT_170353 [Eremomyces bilateralis CBS 781.70]